MITFIKKNWFLGVFLAVVLVFAYVGTAAYTEYANASTPSTLEVPATGSIDTTDK